jgi:undecaprenyl-phosphate 4-deoxy-4-formamido-L-arabinose transferase
MLVRVPNWQSVSVVVPVFNAEATLDELVDRIEATLAGTLFEIVLVNDGSADGSWQRIVALAAEHPSVRGLGLSRNFGQHNALLAGVRAARCDVIVTLDDDLQNPPEEIPKLLAQLGNGTDLVYGTPAVRQHKPWRNLSARLVRVGLKSAAGAEFAASVSPFRAFFADLRDASGSFVGPFVSLDVLLSWATTQVGAVEVEHAERKVGASTYSFGKLVSLAMTMLTGFSTRPLRVASLIGLAATGLGLLMLVYVVVRFFIDGNPVPGFPLLASMIAIFSGAQLFALGIMGEYIGRMHVRTMSQPAYVVRIDTGSPGAQSAE